MIARFSRAFWPGATDWRWRQPGNLQARRVIHCCTCMARTAPASRICCRRSVRRCPAPAYFPLAQLLDVGPGMLEGAAGLPVIAIDDLDAVAGSQDWERALFRTYNDCIASGTRLVVAAQASPAHSGVSLPDLRSRLAAMPQFALRPLDEPQQREALRASRRATRHRTARRNPVVPAAQVRARHAPAA